MPNAATRPSTHRSEYFDASLRMAQHLAGLSTDDDAWERSCEAIAAFFGADLVAVARPSFDGRLEVADWVLPEELRPEQIRCPQIVMSANEVISLGLRDTFPVQFETTTLPQLYQLALLPVVQEGATVAVLIVGHEDEHALPSELLDVYASISALIETTTRKLCAQRDLARHHDMLQQLVDQRTSQLKAANEQLQETARALEQSNENLQQFAYIASHDLQAPLRTVGSFARLLGQACEGKLDDSTREYLNYIDDGVRRMRTLIADLLEYSRVENHGRPFAPVDLGQIVREVLAVLRAHIDETEAQIHCDELPTVLGDATQLTQLLQNLVDNALKFRDDRPPQIHIRAERCDADRWRISVRDNGIGVDPRFADSIFQPFRRLNSRHDYEGTGIGLAVCQRIVQRHQGRIWLEAVPSGGTEFHITVPTVESGVEPAGLSPSGMKAHLAVPEPHARLHDTANADRQ